MKKRRFSLAFIVCAMILSCSVFAQENKQTSFLASKETSISKTEAVQIANRKIALLGNGIQAKLISCRELKSTDQLLAYVVDLEPVGYVVVSATNTLPPVVAYSFESIFGGLQPDNPLFALISADLSKRLKYAHSSGEKYAERNKNAWINMLQGSPQSAPENIAEQWPSTGNGWLKTNWTQDPPYNNFCPMDPVTSQRSYAGCPAVAMAQILNFHQALNNTRFDDQDDYYHNYAGRQYWIDTDYAENGFPSFPQLNTFLDTLQAHYDINQLPDNQDKAAIVFACGVACSQVFTSQGSGTFGVNQALNAYLRFGFTTVSLLNEENTDLYDRLKQNIKDTLPAHLAVVDEAWATGHNVVVDGYNTDDYYHLNFGWGGSYNGWYLLPEEIPFNLTVVEGVVLDIIDLTTHIADQLVDASADVTVSPNPSNNFITIKFHNPGSDPFTLAIYHTSGQLVQTNHNIKGSEIHFDVQKLRSGIYLIVLSDQYGRRKQGKINVL
ncbi:MAG: C10 family peptidase [Bacteroidales bacterium]|nr:C10 family peptidase [Bacteroidales bacterium]